MMMMNRIALAVAFFVLAACGTGCGEKSGLDRVRVSGVATYEGHKITNGSVRFKPKSGSGTAGPASIAPIVDGEFAFDSKGGVPVGTHDVTIEAYVIEGVGAAEGGESGNEKPSMPVFMYGGRKNFLPPKYNQESTIVVTVSGDDDSHVEDFNLKKDD
ncbi:MAG: hypothetical protein ACR2NM_11300 [Bythopirellula sp.]